MHLFGSKTRYQNRTERLVEESCAVFVLLGWLGLVLLRINYMQPVETAQTVCTRLCLLCAHMIRRKFGIFLFGLLKAVAIVLLFTYTSSVS